MKQKVLSLLAACLLLLCNVVMAAGADFELNRVEADGFGLPPSVVTSEAQARLMARRAAIADAQRNLAEQIAGVQVDSETTVQNMQVASDTVRTRVSALLKGAKVISESYEDGAYHVVMALPLYGVTNSLASAVLPQTTHRESFPTTIAPEPEKPLYTPTQPETTTTTTITQPPRLLSRIVKVVPIRASSSIAQVSASVQPCPQLSRLQQASQFTVTRILTLRRLSIMEWRDIVMDLVVMLAVPVPILS